MTTIDPNAQAPNSQTTSALDLLVGQDKKFATAEELAKGKLESDTFVEKLKAENRDLRNLVATQDQRFARLEAKLSILDRLETPPNAGNQPGSNVQEPEPQVTPGMTEEDVLKLVERRDAERIKARNKQEVDNILAKQLGDKAGAFVLQKAAELGMDPQSLRNVALTSPKAFYNMLGIDPAQTETNTVYNGNVNRQAPRAPTSEVRNKAWYDAKQREMGTKKFILDTKLQLQLHKDMTALGEAFFA